MGPWVKKYQPSCLDQVRGQARAISQIRKFLETFKKQKKKALLLHGPAGGGKTCSVVAAAKELKYELYEINASDDRNKDAILDLVGNALKQQSLFATNKLILIDDIDGLSGTHDRGGVAALAQLIKKSAFPIIMTANDAYENKLKAVKKEATVVSFNALDADDVYKVLENICDKEEIKYSKEALMALAKKAQGDLRGAVNDIETLCRNTKELDLDNVIEISEREKKKSVLNALSIIFKGKNAIKAKEALDSVDMNVDETILWVEENLPKEYAFDDLGRAFECVSRADVFRGRIRRWQHWRFLVYVTSLISSGVSAAKDKTYKQFITYQRSSRILKIWIAKQKHAKRKSIAAKLAAKTHCSTKTAFEHIPYLIPVFKQADSAEVIDWLDLDKEEVEWLNR
ncbi:replication factor C large subunit [Candidatus Woesearchaeota archaeon]|nr:replication factor C large subunit [Candidatus Woesearchaeota archaeon]MBW3017844.1 replication factor C large subunit [Candidatus Woesearchaeota archaeon]